MSFKKLLKISLRKLRKLLRRKKRPIPIAIQATALAVLLALPSLVEAASIKISWRDNSDNETSFEIQRKQGVAGTYATVSPVAANVIEYLDAGLLDSTLYCYRVRASNDKGSSGWSNEACATTRPAPVPLAPSETKAEPIAEIIP